MKKRFFIMFICFLVAIGIICCKKQSDSTKDNGIKQQSKYSVTDEKNSILCEFSNKTTIDTISYMNSFDTLEVVKYITYNIINEDKTIDFDVEYYASSDINVKEQTDESAIYVKNHKETNGDNGTQCKFKDIFNLNYENYNKPFDLLIAIINSEGMNIDIENSALDEEYYEITNVKRYVLDNESDLLKNAINDVDYDLLINSYGYYNLADADGQEYISYVGIVIEYQKDNITYMKNIVYSIGIFNETYSCGSECGNGGNCDDSIDCNTDINCSSGCETIDNGSD